MGGRLSRDASGLRHLRWGREVLATLEAHYEHNPDLDTDARAFVLEKAVEVRGLVEKLSKAVKPYRDFLERRRTVVRGMQRMARFRCDQLLAKRGQLEDDGLSRGNMAGHVARAAFAKNLAALERSDELGDAAATLEGCNETFAVLERRERAPLKTALTAAIEAFRAGVETVEHALSAKLGATFVEGVYPELDDSRTLVIDDGDPDDDASMARR